MGFWGEVHKRAFKSAADLFGLGSVTQVVIKLIVGMLIIGGLFFYGSEGAARSEVLLGIFGAAAVIFSFPVVYVYYFLKAPSQIASEKDKSLASLKSRIASETRFDDLQSRQIEALDQQLEFFKSINGPQNERLFDFKISEKVVAIEFVISEGETDFNILMQDIRCDQKTSIDLVLGTDPDDSLAKCHRNQGDYASTSSRDGLSTGTRSISITPELSVESPHGATIRIGLTSLSGVRNNAAVKFEASGFRVTSNGPEYFADNGDGSLLATRLQVRRVCIFPVARSNFVTGNVLAGPNIN